MEDLQSKIALLTERVEYLEKCEKKRVRKRNFQIAFNVIKVIVIIGIIGFVYIKFNNSIIKPTKEKIDFVEEKLSGVSEKVDSVENYVKEKFDSLKNINIFNKN